MSTKNLLVAVCTLAVMMGGCSERIEHEAPAVSTESAITKTREPSAVASFDASSWGLPEGLAVRDGKAYVGFAMSGDIMAIDLASGTQQAFGSLPRPVPNYSFMTGLAFGEDGTLYAALVSFTPEVKAGIYAVPASGGAATLYAENPEMPFPNGIAFDREAGMLVTDSARGAVFQVTKGKASIWASSDLLRGAKDHCGELGSSFDIGANGIAVRDREVVVANSDKASLVRVAIVAGGNAGTPEVLAATDCARLGGADGVAIDRGGDVVVATNRLNRVVRFDKQGRITTLAEANLDFPASLAFDAKANLLVTNFALISATTGGQPHPGLVRIEKL